MAASLTLDSEPEALPEIPGIFEAATDSPLEGNLPDGDRPSILVVDDEEAVARSLAQGLERAGYETDVAFDGQEALLRLQSRSFDILLTDIRMPHLEGGDLQRLARELDPDLAVLIVTASNDISTAVEFLRDGVDDFLTKPFELSDVAVRVGKALEQRRIRQERRRLEAENQDYQANLQRRVTEQAERIRRMFQHSLRSLTYALEAKDESTRNHSARVSEMAGAVAARLFPNDPAFVSKVRIAALYHDIGTIGVSESAWKEREELNAPDESEIRRHPTLGEAILKPLFSADGDLLAIVRQHHERWDGQGYPDGLAAEAISLGARIVGVADAFDILVHVRSGDNKLAPPAALETLRAGAGTQWDPDVVAAFVSLAESGAMPHAAVAPPPPPAPPAPAQKLAPVVQREPSASALTLYLIGDVNKTNVSRIRADVETHFRDGKTDFVVDMRRAGNPDRTGVDMLRQLQKEVAASGGAMGLRHVSRLVQISLDAASLSDSLRPQR